MWGTQMPFPKLRLVWGTQWELDSLTKACKPSSLTTQGVIFNGAPSYEQNIIR